LIVKGQIRVQADSVARVRDAAGVFAHFDGVTGAKMAKFVFMSSLPMHLPVMGELLKVDSFLQSWHVAFFDGHSFQEDETELGQVQKP